MRQCTRFVITLSHSRWSNPERTKGSVAYWAAQAARIKVERDEETGRGKLDLMHQKNGPRGLHLELEYKQHEFHVEGEACSTLIPKRIMDAPERVAKDKAKPAKKLGKNQRIALDALTAAIVDSPDSTPNARDIPADAKGVSMTKWRDAFDRYSPNI